ncbi:hypothetical protein V5N11_002045 [Cardamine amara subsp. amara]|uniref:DUF4283 domain-containing protein n=1 Tax=Cardamine amara subsp. amara TaxID=228776 RepID=A0ABD0ZTB8_CARAN
MSSSIDRALMAMSLEEEDEPFDMPDLSEYCSSEKNVMSIIGRILNPDKQKVANLVMDLPRKWQIEGRVRGVALSKERFQFIFKHQHDMEAILDKGVHTYNEWAIAIERWIEKPPSDYLQYISVWVQIQNIPVNFYTYAAIMAFGELVGQVDVVALDPEKSQRQEFVRVNVKFDVSKPLRRSKVVNLPRGAGSVNLFFDYERVQKRCFSCQRLTHDQSICPLVLKEKEEKKEEGTKFSKEAEFKKARLIPESDPLFGVLEEHQVAVNPNTGRPRIAKEVLEGMRQYLLVADGAERIARAERIKTSLSDLKNDPVGEKSILRLEPAPLLSADLNVGKDIVFEYSIPSVSDPLPKDSQNKMKLMRGAISAGQALSYGSAKHQQGLEGDYLYQSEESSASFLDSSTVLRTGFYEAGSSGTIKKKFKRRRRPPKGQRQDEDCLNVYSSAEITTNKQEGGIKRRDADVM